MLIRKIATNSRDIKIYLGGIMSYLLHFSAILLLFIFISSCKPGIKEMTSEDFIKIENEILFTDLSDDAMENIAKKYKYSLKQYKDYVEKVENDPELKAQVGAVRLQMQKKKEEEYMK